MVPMQNPERAVNEIERLAEQGVHASPETLRIADNCPLILPIHRSVNYERWTLPEALAAEARAIAPALSIEVVASPVIRCSFPRRNASRSSWVASAASSPIRSLFWRAFFKVVHPSAPEVAPTNASTPARIGFAKKIPTATAAGRARPPAVRLAGAALPQPAPISARNASVVRCRQYPLIARSVASCRSCV